MAAAPEPLPAAPAAAGPPPRVGETTDASRDAAKTTRGRPPENGGATDIGITADEIVIANVSDVTGPLPGLFEEARHGTYLNGGARHYRFAT